MKQILIHGAVVSTMFCVGLGLARLSGARSSGLPALVRERVFLSALPHRDGRQGSALMSVARDPDLDWREKHRRYLDLVEAAEGDELEGLLRASVREVPYGIGGGVLCERILKKWSEKDMSGLVRCLVEGELPRADWLEWTALSALAKVDLPRAWDLMDPLPTAERFDWRSRLAPAVESRWPSEGRADAAQCLQLLRRHIDDAEDLMSPSGWRALVHLVARDRPRSLLTAKDSIPPGLLPEETIVTACHAWARTDGEAVREWASGNLEGRVLRVVLDVVEGKGEVR